MKANELRIGNFINTSERAGIHYQICRQGEIKTINNGTCNITPIKCISPVVTVKHGNIEPIILTEEWLLKFGFFENPMDEITVFQKNKMRLNSNAKTHFTCTYNGTFINFILYVHQLQNLYFALTGEELKIIFESDGIKIIPD